MDVKYQLVKQYPTLQAETKKGGIKYWAVRIITDNSSNIYRQTSHWSSTKDGLSEVQESAPRLIKSKNIGKANETTALNQAISECESDIRKKRDEHYVELGEAASTKILPMLADKFVKGKTKLDYPVYLQVKLDGSRLLFNSELGFYSRQGKPYIKEVVAPFIFDTDHLIFDGEVITDDGKIGTFENTITLVKKFRPVESLALRYCIYDVYDPTQPNLPYKDRMQIVKEYSMRFPSPVIACENFTISSEDELLAKHNQFIEEGYEGTIIRVANALYLPNHRSKSLLKLKDMESDEFEVIGVNEGEGKLLGTAIFVLKTKEGKEFKATPKGTLESIAEMWKNQKDYIGKMATIQYANLTDTNVPRFPIFLTLRNYE